MQIQTLINNLQLAASIKTSNKITLDFTPNQLLNPLTGKNVINTAAAQIDIKDTILFAQINFNIIIIEHIS